MRPVILVHGIWNTAAIFRPIKIHLENAGWPTYTFSMRPNNGDAPIEALAQQVNQFVNITIGPQQPFHLIGFSMGGLISRYYLQKLGGLARVHKFIAICAPHAGTVLAFGSNRCGVRQMRPNSPFIRSLNQDAHQLEHIEVSSLWTASDLFILPPWSAKRKVGAHQRLNIPSHNRMIRDRAGLEAIAQILNQT